MMAWSFLLAGAAAGIGQAMSLRRSGRAQAGPLQTAARLALVAAVLLFAAVAGQLPAAAAGWACGLALSTVVIVRRWS